MRTVIFSDIHANLEALEAVCVLGVERGADSWVCLGDIVGYGADPGACIGLVRKLTDQVVLGNHDAAVAGIIDTAYFNDYAVQAVRWTAALLSGEERAGLADLPLTSTDRNALFVHAEPCRPQAWGYVRSRPEAVAALESCGTDLCFIGHSHQPLICAAHKDQVELIPPGAEEIDLSPGRRYLVNVGSVGQPRDGDPRACCALWDDERLTLELVRVEYDIAAAQEKILAAGLPPFLARRLENGF